MSYIKLIMLLACFISFFIYNGNKKKLIFISNKFDLLWIKTSYTKHSTNLEDKLECGVFSQTIWRLEDIKNLFRWIPEKRIYQSHLDWFVIFGCTQIKHYVLCYPTFHVGSNLIQVGSAFNFGTFPWSYNTYDLGWKLSETT